jgi:hypothetical protein
MDLRATSRLTSLALALVVVGTFLVASCNNAGVPSATSNHPQSPVSPNFIGVGTECELAGTVGSPTPLWTPVVLVNAPYEGYGNATESSSISYQGSFSFAYYGNGAGVTEMTSKVSSIGVGAVNGGSYGYFLLDTWTMYYTKNVSVPGSIQDSCTQKYVAEITSTSSTGLWIPTQQSGTENDIDEMTTVSNEGYNSVHFQNGYTGYSNTQYHCAGGTGTISTSTTTLVSDTITGTVSYSGFSSTASMSLTSSSSTSFVYTFPTSSNGEWYEHYLDGSSSTGGLAWDYVSSTC